MGLVTNMNKSPKHLEVEKLKNKKSCVIWRWECLFQTVEQMHRYDILAHQQICYVSPQLRLQVSRRQTFE